MPPVTHLLSLSQWLSRAALLAGVRKERVPKNSLGAQEPGEQVGGHDRGWRRGPMRSAFSRGISNRKLLYDPPLRGAPEPGR